MPAMTKSLSHDHFFHSISSPSLTHDQRLPQHHSAPSLAPTLNLPLSNSSHDHHLGNPHKIMEISLPSPFLAAPGCPARLPATPLPL
jgi:hypothetical protein